ncbi:MAG: type II toxin-antitoxin system HipA family toxin [Akkermansia sp.]
MNQQLLVYHRERLVGIVELEDYYRYSFTYTPEWLQRPDRFSIGHTLPLQQEAHRGYYVQNFFANLLPEGDMRTRIVSTLHIPDRDFALLETLGRDCAGALTIIPPGHTLPEGEGDYTPLTDDELHARLRVPIPIVNPNERWSLSLAGAQGKLALLRRGKKLFMPLNGAPSDCIVKMASPRFPDIVFNEYLCMKTAAAIGLPTAPVDLYDLQGLPLLIVERYDRKKEVNTIKRLHQEDFCQLLGLSHENKYEFLGGPSLAQCAAVLREVASVPIRDIDLLFRWYTFNLLIGNMDAHAKNISVLYNEGNVQLSPFYDLVHTTIYPELRRDPAMMLNGSICPIDRLSREAWLNTVTKAGLPAKRADRMGRTLATSLSNVLKNPEQIIPRGEAKHFDRLLTSLRAIVAQTSARLFGSSSKQTR